MSAQAGSANAPTDLTTSSLTQHTRADQGEFEALSDIENEDEKISELEREVSSSPRNKAYELKETEATYTFEEVVASADQDRLVTVLLGLCRDYPICQETVIRALFENLNGGVSQEFSPNSGRSSRKRWRKAHETCRQCGDDYDVAANGLHKKSDGLCKYHPGKFDHFLSRLRPRRNAQNSWLKVLLTRPPFR